MDVKRQTEGLHARLIRGSVRVHGNEVGPKIVRPAEMFHFPTLYTLDSAEDPETCIAYIPYTERFPMASQACLGEGPTSAECSIILLSP